MTSEFSTLIKVTLRHPLHEVTPNDVARAVLEMEMRYNASHMHRVWMSEADPRCVCAPNELAASPHCPLHREGPI